MKSIHIAALTALALALGACGQSAEEKALEAREKQLEEREKAEHNAPETIEDAVNQLTEAFGGMGESVETIAAKDLKAMLPQEVDDMKRTKASATKNGAFGFTVSTAEATFVGTHEGRPSQITVSINDIGSMQGMARMGMGWLNMEVDEETETGFNRTGEYKGHKSIENYEATGTTSRGQKSVFVDGRFLVDVSAQNVSFEQIEDVLAMVPVDDLAALVKK